MTPKSPNPKRGADTARQDDSARPDHRQDARQSGSGNKSGGTRGGTSEQHAAAGRQSHKNDRKR